MNSRGRIYILDRWWKLKVYSNDFKIFQGNKETLILSKQDEFLLIIKVLKDHKLSFSKLSDDLELEVGKNMVYVSFKGCNETDEDQWGKLCCNNEVEDCYELEEIEKGRKVVSSGLAICEECLRKVLVLDKERGIIIYNHLLLDKEIKEDVRVCEFCGLECQCILKKTIFYDESSKVHEASEQIDIIEKSEKEKEI